MKVTLFNGSPHKGGNTSILLKSVSGRLEAEGIETEHVQLGGVPIHGCSGCYGCIKNKDQKCVITNDILNDCIRKMIESDGIVIGSPTYFASVSAEVKALIDRAGFVSRVNGDLLARKVGAAVIAVRRGGAVTAFDTINHFFTIGQMVVVSSIYWNFAIGREIGEVNDDAEGMATMETLGDNMAWVLKKLHG